MCFYHAVLLTAVLRRTVGILSDEEPEAEVRQLTLRDRVGQCQNQGLGLGPSICKPKLSTTDCTIPSRPCQWPLPHVLCQVSTSSPGDVLREPYLIPITDKWPVSEREVFGIKYIFLPRYQTGMVQASTFSLIQGSLTWDCGWPQGAHESSQMVCRMLYCWCRVGAELTPMLFRVF